MVLCLRGMGPSQRTRHSQVGTSREAPDVAADDRPPTSRATHMHVIRLAAILASALFAAHLAVPAASSAGCRDGSFAMPDARDIAAIKGAIERACPCASYDGSS